MRAIYKDLESNVENERKLNFKKWKERKSCKGQVTVIFLSAKIKWVMKKQALNNCEMLIVLGFFSSLN